jgi:hypothetical protein
MKRTCGIPSVLEKKKLNFNTPDPKQWHQLTSFGI